MQKIGIIGTGRLGICLALNLERVGYEVVAVDIDPDRVDAVNNKSLKTPEPLVDEYLKVSKNLVASTDVADIINAGVNLIFVCVPTPSLPDGTYDHSYIEACVKDLLACSNVPFQVDLVINATTMPGYCETLQQRLSETPFRISYNPEFIAQGSIIRDQQHPDQVLIGEADESSGDRIESVYRRMCPSQPPFHRMSRTSAEITKLAVNCFLTTKIAFANSIGDLAISLDADQDKILQSIGSDSRIGPSFLKYGFGFGGPCLPRDNRALARAGAPLGMELHISDATDRANKAHLDFQFQEFMKLDDPIIFESVTYKRGTDILEESQYLALAVKLMEAGRKVVIRESEHVVNELQEMFSDRFTYEITGDE